jgi:hypothetical protein
MSFWKSIKLTDRTEQPQGVDVKDGIVPVNIESATGTIPVSISSDVVVDTGLVQPLTQNEFDRSTDAQGELFSAMLTELRVISELLNEGLNINTDLDALRDDIENDLDIEES